VVEVPASARLLRPAPPSATGRRSPAGTVRRNSSASSARSSNEGGLSPRAAARRHESSLTSNSRRFRQTSADKSPDQAPSQRRVSSTRVASANAGRLASSRILAPRALDSRRPARFRPGSLLNPASRRRAPRVHRHNRRPSDKTRHLPRPSRSRTSCARLPHPRATRTTTAQPRRSHGPSEPRPRRTAALPSGRRPAETGKQQRLETRRCCSFLLLRARPPRAPRARASTTTAPKRSGILRRPPAARQSNRCARSGSAVTFP
jgi:hypothetical protein